MMEQLTTGVLIATMLGAAVTIACVAAQVVFAARAAQQRWRAEGALGALHHRTLAAEADHHASIAAALALPCGVATALGLIASFILVTTGA